MSVLSPDDSRMMGIAIALAAGQHLGQTDKQGVPYALHPIRVGYRVYQVTGSPLMACIGFLHDIIEDTPMTVDELEIEFSFPPFVCMGVEILTHEKGVSYDAYLRKVKQNPAFVPVKICDIEDNMSRIPGLDDADLRSRMTAKYSYALNLMQS